MPQFNLDEYDLVEDRIRRFYEDHPDGRIITHDITDMEDRAKGYFVVRAQIFTDHEDQHANCPKASGLAFEIEGSAGANRYSALENAETSAIGRALANADYAKGKRPSRSEMSKVQEAKTDAPESIFVDIESAKNREELTRIWDKALSDGHNTERLVKALQAQQRKLDKGEGK